MPSTPAHPREFTHSSQNHTPASSAMSGSDHFTIDAEDDEDLGVLAATIKRTKKRGPAIISRFPGRTGPGSDGSSSPSSGDMSRARPEGEQVDREAFTELGNAVRFIKQHGHYLRYVADRRVWRYWDGARWVDDERGQTIEFAKATIRSLGKTPDDPSLSKDQRRELARFATRSQTHAQITSMIALAQSDPVVTVLADQFDRDPWLLNCPNGVVDLRTGQLRLHQPDDLFAQQTEVVYAPTAHCPLWLDFLDQTFGGDPDLISYIQRVCGYLLTGVTREQCFWNNVGEGENGKSVLQDVLGQIMGDYATVISAQLLMVRMYESDKDYHLAKLPRKRFVYASESGENRVLDEESIKRWTGGEPIVARRLRQSPFTFTPQFKLMLAANRLPQIRGTDHGIWRRIKVVPFEHRVNNPNPSLADELVQEEGAAILAWAVQGCLEYQTHGLQHPLRVEHAVKGMREDMDAVQRFLEECCVVDNAKYTEHGALCTAYQKWCQENGENGKSSKNLSADLRTHMVRDSKHPRTRRKVWLGIHLRGGQDEAQSEECEENVGDCEAPPTDRAA